MPVLCVGVAGGCRLLSGVCACVYGVSRIFAWHAAVFALKMSHVSHPSFEPTSVVLASKVRLSRSLPSACAGTPCRVWWRFRSWCAAARTGTAPSCLAHRPPQHLWQTLHVETRSKANTLMGGGCIPGGARLVGRPRPVHGRHAERAGPSRPVLLVERCGVGPRSSASLDAATTARVAATTDGARLRRQQQSLRRHGATGAPAAARQRGHPRAVLHV